MFGKGPGPGKTLTQEEFEPVATDIFKIPKIFRDMLWARIEQIQGSAGLPQVGGKPTVNKDIILRMWQQRDYHRKDPKRRLFNVIAKEGK